MSNEADSDGAGEMSRREPEMRVSQGDDGTLGAATLLAKHGFPIPDVLRQHLAKELAKYFVPDANGRYKVDNPRTRLRAMELLTKLSQHNLAAQIADEQGVGGPGQGGAGVTVNINLPEVVRRAESGRRAKVLPAKFDLVGIVGPTEEDKPKDIEEDIEGDSEAAGPEDDEENGEEATGAIDEDGLAEAG